MRFVTALPLLLFPALALADMYNVVMPEYLPPTGCTSCDDWSKHTDKPIWGKAGPPPGVGNSCAMPAELVGASKTDPKSSYSGPWCYCTKSGRGLLGGDAPDAGLCLPPKATPEQINLQLAEPSTVVVSFVTYEDAFDPSIPPVATLNGTTLTGVSHLYLDVPNHRNYTMHFVRFADLMPRAQYTYKVKSGTASGAWSPSFSFRAPYASGTSRVAIYGDMGNTLHNNMANLRDDCASGVIDAVVHMGDHAYDLGYAQDRHGDAYMNAFQPVLATCPWLPVIGNHESYLGPWNDKVPRETTERYLNQTWGIVYGQETDTSTTALGSLLTKGTYYGVGSHGSMPSGTSRYNSVDIGLFHIVGLDLDPGPDPGGQGTWSLWNSTAGPGGPSAQGLWLEQDLAAAHANRANVPWIIVTSHFPLRSTMLEANALKSAKHYVGNDGEDSAGRAFTEHHFADCPVNEPDCFTIGELVAAQAGGLIPIMEKYSVDVYDAGHVHSYEVSWPLKDGKVTDKSFKNPSGIVYITEGNGGVPPTPSQNSIHNCTGTCRKKGTGGAYGRFVATDGKTLTYEHVENPTGNVTDTWSITKA